MKHIKRILAIAGVILLAGLYLSTLVFALSDSPNTFDMLITSIAATVIIPVLLWIYTMIYKLFKKQD